MPNQRAPGQKLIAIPMDESIIEIIDEAAYNQRYGGKSAFIRAAVYEKFKRMGIAVNKPASFAPYRKVNGGKKK